MSDISVVRSLVQDVSLFFEETIVADGTRTIFQLKYFPLVEDSVIITGGVADPEFDEEAGTVTFPSAPNAGDVVFQYKHTLLSDTAIQAYLDLNDNVRLAAADALDAMATSQAIILKKIKTLDLQTDGPAVADALRAHAKQLRDRVDFEGDGDFEIVEQVYDTFSFEERVMKDAIKTS